MADEPSSNTKTIVIIVCIAVVVLLVIAAVVGVVLYFTLRKKTPKPETEEEKAIEVRRPTVLNPGYVASCEDYTVSNVYDHTVSTTKDSTYLYQPVVGYKSPDVPKYYVSGPGDRINIIVQNNTDGDFTLRGMVVGFDSQGNVTDPIVTRDKMIFPPGESNLKDIISKKGPNDDRYYAVFMDQDLKWGFEGKGYKTVSGKFGQAPANPRNSYMKIIIDETDPLTVGGLKGITILDYFCERKMTQEEMAPQ